MAVTPYRIPNKSSAVDIILAGVRGGLSGALSVDQANAQREQMNREFDLKTQGIQLQQESLDQQWDIHLADLDQRNKELLANQTMDENKLKLSAQLQDESAKKDLIRQVGTMALQFQMQNVQKTKEMANENFNKSEERKIDIIKANASTELAAATMGVRIGTYDLAKQTAAREDMKFEQSQKMDTLGVLKDIATFDNANKGVDPAVKQGLLNSSYEFAYKSYFDQNQKGAYDDLVSSSIQRARNIFLNNGDANTVVYWYDNKGNPIQGTYNEYRGTLQGDERKALDSGYVTTPKNEPESVKKYKSAAEQLLSPVPAIPSFIPTKSGTVKPAPAPKKSIDTSKTTTPLPDSWNDFTNMLNGLEKTKEDKKFIRDNRDAIRSKYGDVSDVLLYDAEVNKNNTSKPLPFIPTKSQSTKGNLTDIYNRLSKIVNIDISNPNPVWGRMDLNKLDEMVNSTDREQLLTALTTLLSRSGNNNPRVTAENIIKNYSRMVK